jgi:uncharacterized protein (DUF2062 family)
MIPALRSRHPPAHTARGVANGVFWALTPTIGLQTLEMLATWLFLKRVLGRDSSVVQALVWAWINNPLTVVPMYYAFYVTGLWMTGRRGVIVDYRDFSVTGVSVSEVGVPLLVGCLPYAVVGSFLAYRWSFEVVCRRQRRRALNAEL